MPLPHLFFFRFVYVTSSPTTHPSSMSAGRSKRKRVPSIQLIRSMFDHPVSDDENSVSGNESSDECPLSDAELDGDVDDVSGSESASGSGGGVGLSNGNDDDESSSSPHPPPTVSYTKQGYVWDSTPFTPTSQPYQHTPGAKLPAQLAGVEGLQPVDVWLLFFTDDMISTLTKQTNVYAESLDTQQANNFQRVLKQDIRDWIACVYLMGLVDLPARRDYWSEDSVFRQQVVASTMSRNRFEAIRAHLHVVNNNAIDDDARQADKLWKVRPLLDMVEERSQTLYTPRRELALDEMMVGFKGRLQFVFKKQKKPTGNGIKIYAICESTTGYTLVSRVDLRDKTKVSEYVLDLVGRLETQNNLVVMDNYFTSAAVFEAILNMGHHALGTVRKDRVPKGWGVDEKAAQGTWVWLTSELASGDRLALMSWFDSGPCRIMSTAHDPEEQVIVKRRVKGRAERASIPAPKAAEDYNRFMGGVDLADQLRASLSTSKRTRKWWHAVLYWVLDVVIVNAHVVYNAATSGTMSRKDFHKAVARGLLNGGGSGGRRRGQTRGPKKKKPRPTPTSTFPESRFYGRHFPNFGNSESKPKRCRACPLYFGRTGRRQKRTTLSCSECKIALCKDCFTLYHTVEHPSRDMM